MDGTKNDDRRIRYLRETRRALLKKLGLPPDTHPDDVPALLEAKEKFNRLKAVYRKQEDK